MYKKKIKDKVFIYILIIMLLVVIFLSGLNDSIRNAYNIVLEKIFMVENKNIIINDEATKSYIKELENKLNELQSLKSIDHKCINGTVIYRDPSYWYDTLTINVGLNDKIKEKNMVFSSTGLIGTISKVYNDTSVVSLITNVSSKNKITVELSNEEEFTYGIIDRYDYMKKELIINSITSNINNKNIKVTTTGFTNTFDSGILIGYVKEIKSNKDALSKIAVVTPSTDFNNIKYVCVGNK